MTVLRGVSLLALWALSTAAAAQTCPAGNPRVAPDSRYSISAPVAGEEVVTDLATGLMWKRCSEGQSGVGCGTGSASGLTWSEALTAANNASHAGFSDWRLPNAQELLSLVETGCGNPAINTVAFPATPASAYRSSTTLAPVAALVFDATRAWDVDFNLGGMASNAKSSSVPRVRLVRGGQGLDSFTTEADAVPDAFSIAPQVGVPLASLRTSDPVTVAGLTTVTGIGVSGAAGSTYSINGGAFSSLPGAVRNGDLVRVQHTSAATAGTATTTTLTIGGVSANFVSTTGLACLTDPVVANGNDGGAGSLRQSIADACAGSTISFAPAVSTVTLTSAELLINKNLTIDGGAGVTVTRSTAGGTPQFRIFNVLSGNTVAMNRLSVTNGNVSGSGGGILSSGALTLSNCTLSGNTATLRGGGLAVSSGSLDLSGCSLSGNTLLAGDPDVAGGGLSLDAATGSINGCTISGNTSTRVSAVLIQNSTVGLTNCTISGNIDPAPGSSFGAVLVVGGAVTMTNSTVANHAGIPGVGVTTGDPNQLTLVNTIIAGNQRPIGGTVSPLSRNNLIPRFSESFPQTGGLVDGVNGNLTNVTSARIASLGNYGGSLQTIALLPGSPAIDAGSATGAPATDSRGIARPQLGGVDIGAFESRGFTLTASAGNNQSTPINAAFASPLAVTVSSAFGEPVDGGAVGFTPPGSGASATLAGSPATIASGTATSGTVTANGTSGGPYTVVASASGASPANFSLTNLPQADIAITIDDSPDPVLAGGDILYSIGVRNNGPATAVATQLSVPLPAGLSFRNLITPALWSCTTPAVGAGGTVNCLVNLPSPSTSGFGLVARVDPATAAGTVISLTGTLSSATNDPNPANNAATATTTVDPVPTVTVTPTTLNVSEAGPTSSSFTVRLSSAPGSNVTVALSFPGDQVQVDTGSGFGTSPQTVTLTPANAVAGVSVAVRAVDDSLVESNPHAVTITTANTASSAPAFDGLAVADVGVSIADNDTADVSIVQSGGSTAVTEGGATDTYTAVLTSQPTANVTVNLAFDAAQLIVNGETDGTTGLTFTPTDWNVAQSVNVTAVDDTLIEANPHTSLIAMTISSGDAAYAGIDPADVTVSIAENDLQQITFSQPSSSVSESAGTHTVTARLNLISNGTPGGTITADMTATVNATPGSAQAGDYTLGTTSLTFPAGSTHNASLPISVAITNDRTVEGAETFTLGLQLSTAQGSVSGTHTVTLNDDDGAAISFVNPSSNVAESVGTAVVPTVLSITGTGTGAPALGVNVVVGINQAAGTATTPADYQLTSTSLSFAAGTEPGARRDVEVAVVNDALIEGNHNFQLGFGALTTTASNASASGLHTVTIVDDDLAGVVFNESGGSTVVTEGGASDSLALTLSAQPTSNVTITFDVGTQVSFAPNPLVITPAQWNVPQTISVTAVDDAVVEGPHSATVGLVFTGDASFAAITPNSIAQLVSITDNDVAGVTVTPSGGSTNVTEGGATDSYTLVLTSQPTANVVIAIAGGTQLTTSPTSATFTAANWNVAQTVTVTAVDDALAEGLHNGSVAHTVTSADATYDGRMVDSVSVTITDNDAADVTVTESGGNTAVTEGGASDTISVVLGSQPVANVTVTLTPNAQLTASPNPLTFTNANWNVAQAVTVTAADDNVVEGGHNGTLGFGVASTDPAYGSITLPSITASVTDNDSATVQFAPTSLSQSEGTSPMAFTVTLSTPVASGVTVTVNSANGTAIAGSDYTAVTGQTVSFAPNSTTAQTVNVAITNDTLDEADETYTLTLSNVVATGDVTLGAASSATGTIEDDDALPVLSVANVTQPEGNATNTLTFTVTLSPVSGRAVSFTRATTDGTAVSSGPNADFVALASDTLTIPAGQTSVTIPVTINGDTAFEGDEQFTLSLSGITNANVGGTTITGTAIGLTATATLQEDDQQPTTTTITADLPDPSVVGEGYPVTVEVRAQTLSPLGTVSISDGTGASCNATLVAGTAPVSTMTCTLTSTTAGAKTLTASYTPASTAFGESSDTEAHTVNAAATSLVLLGPARARIGTAASYTAELSVTAPGSGTPAGTVTVTAGADSCTITLPTATPSCAITYGSLGSRTVTAVFAPADGNYAGSTSTPVQTLVFASADVSVTKTNAVATYRPGDLLVWTVTVGNAGPDAAPQVRIRDVAPAGLTNVAWTCVASGGAVCPDAGGTGTLDHVVVTLPANSQLTYAYFGNVIGRPLQIVNVAEVTLPADTTIEDPNLSNNTASDTDRLDDLFADGFEAPGINAESGGVRLPGASLRSTLDEVARVTVRLYDVRGEALRVYARVIGGELQVALAVRGADGSLRLGAWQVASGEPELVWTATESAGGWVLGGASLR